MTEPMKIVDFRAMDHEIAACKQRAEANPSNAEAAAEHSSLCNKYWRRARKYWGTLTAAEQVKAVESGAVIPDTFLFGHAILAACAGASDGGECDFSVCDAIIGRHPHLAKEPDLAGEDAAEMFAEYAQTCGLNGNFPGKDVIEQASCWLTERGITLSDIQKADIKAATGAEL